VYPESWKSIDFHLSLGSTIFVSDIFSSVLGRNPWRISFLLFSRSKNLWKKQTKQNKTTRVGGLLAHARTTGSLSNKTEKGYIYSSLRPFLSMSLHFYYFFLFLYTSLILPSYFRCLAMVVVVGRLQPSNTQPSKGHVFFFLFYNWREQKNRKEKDVDFKRTRAFRFSLIRCDSRFLFLYSYYYSTSTLFHFRLFPECQPPTPPSKRIIMAIKWSVKKKEMTVLEIKWHSNILSPVSCIFKCQSRPGAVSGNVDSL
jgi:hypothetical protein